MLVCVSLLDSLSSPSFAGPMTIYLLLLRSRLTYSFTQRMMLFNVARNQQLELNRAVVMREVSFYGLALALLWYALSDRHTDKNDGDVYIRINFFQAASLLAGFGLYVLVCAYFGRIEALFFSGTTMFDDRNQTFIDSVSMIGSALQSRGRFVWDTVARFTGRPYPFHPCRTITCCILQNHPIALCCLCFRFSRIYPFCDKYPMNHRPTFGPTTAV